MNFLKNYQEKIIIHKTNLDKLKALFKSKRNSFLYINQLEYMVESLDDLSLFYNLSDVKKWFREKRKLSLMTTKKIGLNRLNNWKKTNKGDIYHISNEFFVVHGVRTFTSIRETNEKFWDQPILAQVGLDGGLLGLIRKRFNGIPHYLCEAKFEPGNYGKAQISPTIQATFSNIKRAHKGAKPEFTDLFLNMKKKNFLVLFDSWMAEDGGRMYKKRNRSILLEIPEKQKIKLPSNNFIWLSLYQIKALLKENAWINPHMRGIIAHT